MLMEGFSMVLSDPLSVVLVAVGTLIGTIFGAIPGLTATMAVTICLPMTFAMSDSRAIALLMALYIGGISGGLVSSILLNIPGTPASMVTAFDGAPMARKGEGAKALGTGIFFSFLGTIFGLIALIIIAPYLAAVAIKFGAFEYCALSIFSLSLVISLAGKDMVKGLAAALLGVMFSTFDSIVRYDFGSVNMQSGFQQLVVLIGLYAIPEVVGVAQKVVKPKVIMQQNTTVDKIRSMVWASPGRSSRARSATSSSQPPSAPASASCPASAAVLPVSCPTPLSRTAPRLLKSSAPALWTASWLLKRQTTLPSAAQ